MKPFYSRSRAVRVTVASAVYRRFVESHGMRRERWRRIRHKLIKWWNDPACEMLVQGRVLRMPLSHALPEYLKRFPYYDRLPARLARFIRSREQRIITIDVGANIGDTIASVLTDSFDRCLAIEPNPSYYQYLLANWQSDRRVVPVECFCSLKSEDLTCVIEAKRGTASLRKHPDGVRVKGYALDDLLQIYPEYASCNFLKIDTDGHDVDVLGGGSAMMGNRLPVILFEMDSFGASNYDKQIEDTMAMLRGIGYRAMFVYDNYGRLFGKIPLSDSPAIRRLLFYHCILKTDYYDCLLMREEWASEFYRQELEYFARAMSNQTQSLFHGLA